LSDKIKLAHGDGGTKTNRLIRDIFLESYGGDENLISDSFVFTTEKSRLAFTTDSFIVKPLFFRGGDIGKLAVCGTINDLATAGAKPLYLSAGFIIEEGFEVEELRKIANSMGEISKNTGVRIVTGDTKVIEKGSADGLFINTSGIGIVSESYCTSPIEAGDEIIITGSIAEHGTAILLDRYDLEIESDIISDCCPLNFLVSDLANELQYIKMMKDPTRGGLATILNEIAASTGLNAELYENQIPINKQVKAVNDLLGIDPLYLACEGRMVIIIKKGYGKLILEHLHNLKECENARIIGRFTSDEQGIVYLQTNIGGRRILPALDAQTVPRIC
jgi:hydrogenase expression/formation protein HypE